MNDATVRFGYDGTALNAGLAEGEQRLKRFGSSAETQFRRTSAASEQMGRNLGKRAGMWGLGNVSMQLQDVAVQMQSGTKASIIFAQQGSQLLSAFGPMGMIAGLAAGVGGALYTLGENGKKAFAEATAGADEFEKSMRGKLLGTTTDIANALTSIEARGISLKNEMSDMSLLQGAVTEMVGGPKMNDRITFNADQQRRALELRREMGRQLAATSEQEMEIIRLRAAGDEQAANELERQIKLTRQLADIDKMAADGWVKDKLKADAIEKSNLKPVDVAAAREKVMALEKNIQEQKLAQLDPVEKYLELSKQQEAVLARMATEGGLFFEESVKGLEEWAAAVRKSGDVQNLAKVLGMLEEVNTIQKRMADASNEVAQKRDQRDQENATRQQEVAAIKAKSQAEQDRFSVYFKNQQEAKKTLREEIMMARARLNGNTALLAQMERELRVREKTKQIMDATNMNEADARSSAEFIINSESSPVSPSGTGRRRRTTGPLSPNTGPLSKRSGPLSLSRGSLADRPVYSVDAARAANASRPADVGGKIDKTNELLARLVG